MLRAPYFNNLMIYSIYFAPRGRDRLLLMGEQLSQRHMSFMDRLIGIVGDAGSGKSSLIKGMFPGLELVNDDDRINPRRMSQFLDCYDDMDHMMTFHIDMRFQMAFTQMHELVYFVRKALESERRVIVEHFDLLYPALNINADLLVGIGEEIIITRPNIFGPSPSDIFNISHNSLKYRLMAHTAEDITSYLLEHELDQPRNWLNADVRRGFVLDFLRRPEFDIERLEARINDVINSNADICYLDENHIRINGLGALRCSGPRLHVRNTSEIINFRLLKDFIYDPTSGYFSLVGILHDYDRIDYKDLNSLRTFEQSGNKSVG